MLTPTITPESGTDCDDFYQSRFQNPGSESISNNLYGHEFLDFDTKIDHGLLGSHSNEYGYNLPDQAMMAHQNTPGTLFCSWKASSVPNPMPQPQIDPSTGLPLKICSNCGSISTPSWRRCPQGRNLLCNACGLYQKLHGRPRPLRIREDGSVQVIRNTNPTSKNVCQNCKTTETPSWRRCQGNRNLLLCNACALYLKNNSTSRPSRYNYTDHNENLGN